MAPIVVAHGMAIYRTAIAVLLEQRGLEACEASPATIETAGFSDPTAIVVCALADIGRMSPQPGPALVVLCDQLDPSHLRAAIGPGANALLGPDATPNDLVAAIEDTKQGKVRLSASVAAAIAQQPPEVTPAAPLSKREVEVLQMLGTGASNHDIAANLHISERTAAAHVSAILGKLGVENRTRAVVYGLRRGMIDPAAFV